MTSLNRQPVPPVAADPGYTLPLKWLTVLLAFACGAIVANLYYAQPLAGLIAASIGLAPGLAGTVVTLSQIGYCLGLLLIVPLGDLLETRRLVVGMLMVNVLAILLAVFAGQPWSFLFAAFVIGLTSVVAQILVPYASHLAPAHQRGQMVGNVMSGLMLGILFARPLASFVAAVAGWHGIFAVSAILMVMLALLLQRYLPERRVQHDEPAPRYTALLQSLWHLLLTTPALRRRAFYQFFFFGSFSMFWTTVPLLLSGSAYQWGQGRIAWYGLAGVAGAIAAPLAGRLADRGLTRPATGIAFVLALAAYGFAFGGSQGGVVGIGLLVLAAIVLDMAVTGSLVLGQRTLFELGTHTRSRLNGIFMAIFFLGGAAGSAGGAWMYQHAGWRSVVLTGMGMAILPFLYFLTESKSSKAAVGKQ